MKKQIFLTILFIVFLPLNFLHSDITIDGKGGDWDLLTKGSLAISTGNKLTLKDTISNSLCRQIG